MRQLSYDHCGSEVRLLGETIGECLDRIAAAYAGNDALVSIPQKRRFTYGEFNRVVNRAAKAFMRLGIERGDRVAIWSPNNYEWVVSQFATARIGAVLVNINPAYRTHEFEYVLKESRAKAMLLVESYKSSNYVQMLYEVCPEAKTCEPGRIDSWRFPNLRDLIFIGREHLPGMFTRREFAEMGDELPDDVVRSRQAELDIDDVINIQYTSGTTGFPKGVLLTHNNLVNNGFWVGEMLSLSHKDRLCVAVPFYHCFGMVVSNLAAITHGATIIIPSPVFEPLATLQAVQAERATVLHGVPTMFIAELSHADFDKYDLSSLRTGIMAGAPCPVEVMRKVQARMHIRDLLIAYGMTESSPVTTITRAGTSEALRVSTVGTVMPHQELKIIDPLTGQTLPRGKPGEICFRGYMVMRGYDNNPKATHETIDDAGWLHSGDLGTMDESGFVRITGRIKEMVIRGGENIYPREIEEFLHTLDIIEDAQVVGVPDETYGEELLACVKLRRDASGRAMPAPTDEQFKALCKGRIAHFKIPRYWLMVEEYPMTVSGKIQKYKLREWAIHKLGLVDNAIAANRGPEPAATVPSYGRSAVMA